MSMSRSAKDVFQGALLQERSLGAEDPLEALIAAAATMTEAALIAYGVVNGDFDEGCDTLIEAVTKLRNNPGVSQEVRSSVDQFLSMMEKLAAEEQAQSTSGSLNDPCVYVDPRWDA